jgi:hypothetical protein
MRNKILKIHKDTSQTLLPTSLKSHLPKEERYPVEKGEGTWNISFLDGVYPSICGVP